MLVIHGFGHTLCTVIFDKARCFIRLHNVLENRKPLDILRSLLPFQPIFIPFIHNEFHPWIAAGNTNIQAKALGGISFNLLALVITFWFLFTKPGINLGMQFILEAFIAANLVITFSSWSDIAAFIQGTAACFYCGNFGIIGKPNSNDGNQLLPKRFVYFFTKWVTKLKFGVNKQEVG
ncbi:hypothetical protein [Nostoc sp.]|uniref:hypothetical protein n=1 Tax=Nostoc sp. TaxID=1180 RepID=UPI002FF58E34